MAEAQQQAAQEAGHVAQYRSLAEGAEENTRIVQVPCNVREDLDYSTLLLDAHASKSCSTYPAKKYCKACTKQSGM